VKSRNFAGLALDLLAAAGVAILLLQDSDATTLAPNLVILALLLAHLLHLRTGPDNVRLALTKPDMRLVLLVLLVATIFGPVTYGIYAAALYSGLSLVLGGYLAKNS
jgi:hypothetical protein